MSEDWNTKYGPRRVRRDPPTLDEAIFAAIGITDDQQAQTEIAAALMGMPFDTVLAEVKKQSRVNARATTRVIAGEQGAQRSVVVERRVVRKFAIDKRTGKLLWQAVLPFAGNATPITYLAGGTQYIVIYATGGKAKPDDPAGGVYVAFRLKNNGE